MEERSTYILMDVGGTQIKAGLSSGTDIKVAGTYLSCSKEDREAVLHNFAVIIRELMTEAGGIPITGIGMAFPGPFDYGRGISRMKGLDKYDSIYGCSIEAEIKSRVKELSDVKFCFLHDVEAFAIGESWLSDVRELGKLICLCIGTGAGSAFIKDRAVLKEPGDGVPVNGWVYNAAYRESVIDDYLSVRGLERICRQVMGTESDGKALYELCRQGNENAYKVFEMFGQDLQQCMIPYLNEFEPDAVVLGGQISKSFCYFGKAFEEECRKRNIKVYLEQETSVRAMQGLLMTMMQEEEYVKS